MPANKSHHYVPQMYMRLFSADAVRVGVFVLASRRFIPAAPIRGQACRDYFYGRDPGLERAFAKIEGTAAKLFADMRQHRRVPTPGGEDHEQLIFYLGMQHCRTMAAADLHDEGSEKAVKAMLRRQAELEGNELILENLDRVRIRRTNAVSEVVRYATIGANLLTDLTFTLIVNDSGLDFVASDAPVVLHNRLYEGQDIGVTGYANVGLQLFLPLGPRLALLGYDAGAYDVARDDSGVVRVSGEHTARLINDLQWEGAHAVILVGPGMSGSELDDRATHWSERRRAERVVFREEVMEQSETQARTRQGGGQAPSGIALDLDFVTQRLPVPPVLGRWEMPPFRDPARVDRTDRAFARMDQWDADRRDRG